MSVLNFVVIISDKFGFCKDSKELALEELFNCLNKDRIGDKWYEDEKEQFKNRYKKNIYALIDNFKYKKYRLVTAEFDSYSEMDFINFLETAKMEYLLL